MRTIQMPNFSFQRSSTPMPYSFGKPALNCCGGSLRTFGNMNRPVAASAAADAAENAPQARPIQARRVNRGEVSSGSRVAAFAVAAGAVRAAAAPAGEAAVGVGCGVPAAFAPVGGALAVCPATAEPVLAAAAVASPVCGTIFGA